MMKADQEVEVDNEPQNPRQGLIYGIAAVVIVIGVVILLWPKEEPRVADEPPAVTDATESATAVELATAFVQAYGAFDLDGAASYLASDANLSGFGEDWPANRTFLEAIGFKLILDSCEETSDSPVRATARCRYDFHAIRSDEIGQGPFTGNYFDLTIEDGEITVVADHLEVLSNRFSQQMWEPFAEWVAENHPDDVTIMYTDASQSMQQLTDESIALWEQRSREWAERDGTMDSVIGPPSRVNKSHVRLSDVRVPPSLSLG